MCQSLYNSLPAAKGLFDRATGVLGYDLAAVCFNGPAEKLNSTVISQPALYVGGLAALESLKQTNPDVVDSTEGAAGLSLGEYTAITFAGGLSFEDGLILVQQRGEAMQAASDATASGMVSILGLDRDQVDAVCDEARVDGEILHAANFLCPGNIAVSGHRKSCLTVDEVAVKAGAMKTIPLAVAGAFHTEIMRSAVDRLATALDRADFRESRIPVYSKVDARPHTNPLEFRQLLKEQVCSPVCWHESMQRLLSEGFDRFYEVGPGRVLRGLLKRIDRKASCEGTLD